MIFSLAIYGAPYSSQASDSAYRFATAALAGGHSIYRLFFYADGVHNATRLAAPPQDENNLPRAWRQLIEAHAIDSVGCIASALRRGIINGEEAERYGCDADNLAGGFEISGLGQLLDAAVRCDRLITFGD